MCIGCPSGWRCHKRVWGRCIFGLPGWNSCCKRLINPICAALNLKCTVVRRVLQAAIWVAVRVVQGAKRSLDIAKAGLYLARKLVRAARHTLNIAVAALNVVRKLYRVGIQALTTIVRVGLGGLINIREIYFRVSLGAASHGSFSGRIRVSFLGRSPVTIGLHINVRNPWTMVKQLASRVIPGIAMQAEWKSPSQLK